MVGLLHPGYGENPPYSNKSCQLPSPHLLSARWASSVFHWYDHLATVFIPSVGLEDVIAHIEALSQYTQQALKENSCPPK